MQGLQDLRQTFSNLLGVTATQDQAQIVEAVDLAADVFLYFEHLP